MKTNTALVESTSAWDVFLAAIAGGVKLEDAKLAAGLTNKDIEAKVNSDPVELQRWCDARLSAMRASWSVFALEEVFARIGRGTPSSQAVVEVRGEDDGSFWEITEAGPLRDSYLRAESIAARRASEQLLTIADDQSTDVLPNGRGGEIGNMAAVGRAKVRIEARTFRMGKFSPDLFGDRPTGPVVNVQVNLAERLEEARTRVTTMRANGGVMPPADVVPITQNIVDAAFRSVPPDDTEPGVAVTTTKSPPRTPPVAARWVDEPATEETADAEPLSSLWLEET